MKIRFSIFLLLLVSCGGPKIIPDKELAQIFHDIYLVNSYVGQNNRNVDSLNIYEPVFASYGYTSEDIQYTIGNFAKRKSARLSEDVVGVAVEMLRRESDHFRRRIQLRDTISLIARKKFAEQVLFDSLIRVRRIADTSRLRIVLSDIRPGSYEVSYGYLVDSLDRNPTLMTNVWFVDATGRRSGSTSPQRLERGRYATVKTILTASENERTMVLGLNGYSKNLTTPNITVDDLRVTYYLPDELAVEKLARSWLNIGSDSLPYLHETHFIAPLVDAARTRIR